jgi:hypothetical protein
MGPFLFCGTEIPASRIALLRKTEDLSRGMSRCAPQPRLLEGRGFGHHSGLKLHRRRLAERLAPKFR